MMTLDLVLLVFQDYSCGRHRVTILAGSEVPALGLQNILRRGGVCP